MTVTRCSSSHLMTGLLAWRNPQGSEENWINSISRGIFGMPRSVRGPKRMNLAESSECEIHRFRF